MTRISSKLFESSVWLYAVGNFLFSYAFTRKIFIFDILALILTTLFMCYLWLLPKRLEFRMMDQFMQYEPYCYDFCRLTNRFEHTYKNQNPATKLMSGSAKRRADRWFMLKEDIPLVERIRKA
jgi:hypothetical protein